MLVTDENNKFLNVLENVNFFVTRTSSYNGDGSFFSNKLVIAR